MADGVAVAVSTETTPGSSAGSGTVKTFPESAVCTGCCGPLSRLIYMNMATAGTPTRAVMEAVAVG